MIARAFITLAASCVELALGGRERRRHATMIAVTKLCIELEIALCLHSRTRLSSRTATSYPKG